MMDFTEYCKALAEGTLQLNDEQQRQYVQLAGKIADKLKPDTVISKGAINAILDEIRKEQTDSHADKAQLVRR